MGQNRGGMGTEPDNWETGRYLLFSVDDPSSNIQGEADCPAHGGHPGWRQGGDQGADCSVPQSSPHACSVSQTENSSAVTGCRS